MLLIEDILGNRQDAGWQERLAGLHVDMLALDQWEAQKNRLRKKTVAGVEIALALPRQSHLHDGDVLFYDEAAGEVIVARITLKDVMVINLSDTEALSPELIARTCFELGHALGNQHWPAVVKEGRVYVPLTVDRKVMESVMRTHSFEHIHYSFMPGAGVIPYLAPHETRRLFGGADSTPHNHVSQLAGEGDGARMNLAEHGHCHEHTHQHDDGTEHAHPHEHTHQHLQSGDDHHHAEVHGNFTPHRHDH